MKDFFLKNGKKNILILLIVFILLVSVVVVVKTISGDNDETVYYEKVFDEEHTLSVGETVELSRFLSYSADVDVNIVNYSVLDESVVSIDEEYNITALLEGETTVIVEYDDDTFDEIELKVVTETSNASTSSSSSITSLTSSVSSKQLKYKEKFTLKITSGSSEISYKKLSFSSSDTSIAKVSSKGVVTAKSKMGVATITIKSKENSSIKTTVKIVTVPSSGYNGESANSYTSLKSLGTLTPTKQISISSSDGTYRWAQGFCVVGKYYVAAQTDANSEYAYISVYNKTSGKLIKTLKGAFGHANGLTYNPNNATVYFAVAGSSSDSVATYGDEHRIYYASARANVVNKKYSSLDASVGGFYNSKSGNYISFGSVAYDKDTKLYYLGSGGKVYVYNADTQKIVRTITKVYTGTTQDIAAYHGLVYVIRFDSNYKGSSTNVQYTRNAIDIYRVSDGAYLGSYIVKTGDKFELESLDYYGTDKKFALYFHESGGYTSYIYTVDISL